MVCDQATRCVRIGKRYKIANGGPEEEDARTMDLIDAIPLIITIYIWKIFGMEHSLVTFFPCRKYLPNVF